MTEYSGIMPPVEKAVSQMGMIHQSKEVMVYPILAWVLERAEDPVQHGASCEV